MFRPFSSLYSALLKSIQAETDKPRAEIAGFKVFDFKNFVFDGEHRITIR